MTLSDRDLWVLQDRELGEDGGIVYPWNPDHVQSASIDLTLGNEEMDEGGLGWEVRSGNLRIYPQQFKLATTAETVHVPSDHAAEVKGRSSWARFGLLVECAGFIDPGFRGQITLELFNLSNRTILVPVGERVCQIKYTQLTSRAERPYGSEGLGSHYQNQNGVTSSALLD